MSIHPIRARAANERYVKDSVRCRLDVITINKEEPCKQFPSSNWIGHTASTEPNRFYASTDMIIVPTYRLRAPQACLSVTLRRSFVNSQWFQFVAVFGPHLPVH